MSFVHVYVQSWGASLEPMCIFFLQVRVLFIIVNSNKALFLCHMREMLFYYWSDFQTCKLCSGWPWLGLKISAWFRWPMYNTFHAPFPCQLCNFLTYISSFFRFSIISSFLVLFKFLCLLFCCVLSQLGRVVTEYLPDRFLIWWNKCLIDYCFNWHV